MASSPIGVHQEANNVVSGGHNNKERRSSSLNVSGGVGFVNTPCYSHRNVKHSHQMLIAENIYDPSLPLVTKSRLNPSLKDVLNDNNSLGYFMQFMESEGRIPKNTIVFWLQVECFRKSLSNTCSNGGSSSSCSNHDDDYDMDNGHPEEKFFEDATRIYNMYLETTANQELSIPFDKSIKESMEEKLFKTNRKAIKADMFENIQSQLLSKMDSEFYEKFLRSSYFCKYKIDILTDGTVCVSDIIFNDSTLFLFMDFMEQEGMKHYLDFLLMAENCRQYGNSSDTSIVFERFFLVDSPSYLEMSSKLKDTVKANLKSGTCSTCFDLPMGILLQYLEKTYFRQFLQSQTYINHLTECINSLQYFSLTTSVNTGKKGATLQSSHHHHRHRRQSSDSSSLYSECCSNPGSHNSNPPHQSSNCIKSSSNNLVDSNSSLRASVHKSTDTLWQRDLAGKLQIATVNQYGKLLSDFEPEPEKALSQNGLSAKSFTKAVRNMIGSGDEKAKEDLAWRVAEMIVNDVCYVTQMTAMTAQSTQSNGGHKS